MSQVAAEQAAQDLIEVSAETKSTEQDLAELRGPQQQTLDTITISERPKPRLGFALKREQASADALAETLASPEGSAS